MRVILVNHHNMAESKGKRTRDQLSIIGDMVKHHDEVYYQDGFTEPLAEADAYVQCGNVKQVFHPNTKDSYAAVKNSGKPVLLRDVCIFRDVSNNRHDYPRLAWNDFGPTKGLHPYDPSYDRWKEKFNLPIEDWQRRGDKVLVSLQLHKDASLHEIHASGETYYDVMGRYIRELLTKTDRPVVIRPHPKSSDVHVWQRMFGDSVEYSTGDMREALNDTWCLVTFNSTSSVEASLYGTPCITLDHSAATRDISYHSLDDIEKDVNFNTLEWCRKAAFWQWTHDEILNNGPYIWSLLRKCIL